MSNSRSESESESETIKIGGTDHNLKPLIVCDPQGGILVISNDLSSHSSGFLTNIIKNENLTRDHLLNNYNIKYESFYDCSKDIHVKMGNSYFGLIDKNSVINFLINIYTYI